jgi:hypothetical protein
MEYRRLDKVYCQGDHAKGVKYIQRGAVKLSVVNEVGKEAAIVIGVVKSTLAPCNQSKIFDHAASLASLPHSEQDSLALDGILGYGNKIMRKGILQSTCCQHREKNGETPCRRICVDSSYYRSFVKINRPFSFSLG